VGAMFEQIGGNMEAPSLADSFDFYNNDAIEHSFKDAVYDTYGNPSGGAYDLAKDGAFKGYRVLIGCFCTVENLPQDIEKLTVPELKKKGFDVEMITSEDEFTKRISTEKFHCAWILSSNNFAGSSKEEFKNAVVKYHEAGRGLFIFGDNDPYYVQANIVLPALCDCSLTGNTPGGKELCVGQATNPKQFGKHMITAGVLKLNEGVTICYPTKISSGMEVVGTSSDNHPVLVVKRESKARGRIVLDNGFTKLMSDYWTTAGTPRYVSNCCVWLVNRERFLRPNM